MPAKIVFTGRTTGCSYSSTPFSDQLEWLKEQTVIGLDTETNVTESILNRVLHVISIANTDGSVMWVIDWHALNDFQKENLLEEIRKKLCIIHNVSFDYQVLRKQGLILNKVYDTMLAEKILTSGLSAEQGYHGLKAIYLRRFDMDISKAEQTSFTGDPLTDEQIRYSAIDVYKLGTLRNLQINEMKYEDKRINLHNHKGLSKTLWWENEFVKVVADMEYEGIYIDKDKWDSIEAEVQPIWEQELSNLNTLVAKHFYDVLEDNEWISDKDKIVTSIWTSSAKKKEILEKIFPDIPFTKTSQVELKKILKEYDPDFPEGLKISGRNWENSDYPTHFTSKFSVIKLLILYSKNKEQIKPYLDNILLGPLRKFAIDKGWVVPANTITLKWSSPAQRLKIFQAIDPNITSTNKEVLADYIEKHEIIPHYLEWARVDFIKKSFGKAFYTKYVDLDGRFRARFNQILATGRLSSVNPNLLAIPSDPIYRKCFVPQNPEKEVLIGADYDQEELLITGVLANEKTWINAFKKKQDLHSINAELIYKDKWANAALPDCRYYAEETYHKKCSCAEHATIRNNTKTIEFGTLYGLGSSSLAARLKIPKSEADSLISEFFNALPGIQSYLTRVKNFAVKNRYIVEPVFGRVRYYDKWKFAVEEELAGIERKSANYTIQAAGSAILKIFAVLFRRWIYHNNLENYVKILLLVHDETLVQSFKDLPGEFTVEDVRKKVEDTMVLAAKLARFDLLQAEAAIGPSWADIH